MALLTTLVLVVIKNLAGRRESSLAVGGQIKEKVEDFGEDILGQVVEHLPGAPDLGEANQDEEGQIAGESDENGSEPISQPVENIQNQTQQLIESIKKLPQDQIEAVKKQIYKEVCESWITKEVEEGD